MIIRFSFTLIAIFIFSIGGTMYAQSFTMGNACNKLSKQGIAAIENRKYDSALVIYQAMKASCKTKDAKIAIAVGNAEALNGLGRHEEALAASNEALKISKNMSLNGWFQRGVAESKTGRTEASKASLNKVTELTVKNRNIKERASNYALMAALYDRQLGETDSAHYFIDQAISFDPANYRYYLEKGDMYSRSKQYEQAFEQYNLVESLGKSDLELYQTLCDTRINMLQEKYNTNNTQQLRSKLSADEKSILCKDLKRAQELGMRNMNKDMFTSLICK